MRIIAGKNGTPWEFAASIRLGKYASASIQIAKWQASLWTDNGFAERFVASAATYGVKHWIWPKPKKEARDAG